MSSGLASHGDAFYIWGAIAVALALIALELAILAARRRDLRDRTHSR